MSLSPQLADWQPDADILYELAGYLRDALNPRDPGSQKHATLMLTQAKSKTETARYLAYIYAKGSLVQKLELTEPELTLLRSSAVINLKNVIKSTYKRLDETTRAFLKQSVLSCLSDAHPQVRLLAGTVIAEIVQKGSILSWPDLLDSLLSFAANDTGHVLPETQEASMNALLKICEDRQDELEQQFHGQRPDQHLLPRLLDVCSSANSHVRALAVACLNAFIHRQSSTLEEMLDAILQRFFQLANDEDSEVQKSLCRGFVLISEVRPEKITPHMNGLVEYMCFLQRNKNEPELALEAAEFWLTAVENENMHSSLEPHLSRIIPVLLESMVYDEETIIGLSGAEEDISKEDREEDVKPVFAASKSHRLGNGVQDLLESREEGEIEDEDETNDEDAEIDEQWNLRKCSAAALDVFASRFQQGVFDIALEYLNKNLTNSEWPYRESAVLAMGAIAEGCMDSVAPALPNIIPYLTSLLHDPEPSVRQITCWALGRYSVWVLSLDEPEEKQRYFNSILDGILRCMIDKIKKVQTAAASALASIEEKADTILTVCCNEIVMTFVTCFEIYKSRNLYVLYDCVQTFAERVGPVLREAKLTDLLMPAIIKRWQIVPDQSRELFPLHECLSYITAALGEAFAPFAAPIFSRCIRILHQNLELLHVAEEDESFDRPDRDFLITSLDLLSAIIQALRPEQSVELVQTTQPRFFDLLLYCMRDPSNDVRQSSYALLGDCAIYVYPQLQQYLPALIGVAIGQLESMSITKEHQSRAGFSVINNACWSLGEIAIRDRDHMPPHVENLYRRLKRIMDQPSIPDSVAENAVITIGRLGVYSSEILSPYLGEFIGQFLRIVEPVQVNEEKGHAFLGLNRIIVKNPYAIGPNLFAYLQASSAYTEERPDPRNNGETIGESFQQVLVGYKSLDREYFEQVISQMPFDQQQRLQRSYKIS